MEEAKREVIQEAHQMLRAVDENIKQAQPERAWMLEPMLNYFDVLEDAMRRERPMIWHFLTLSQEPMRAMDAAVFSPEYAAAVFSILGIAFKYYDLAADRMPEHICVLNRFPAGLSLSGDTVIPDIMLYTAANPCDAIRIEADVSKTDQVQAMVRRTVEAFGRLDYAFNNAGVEAGIFPLDQYKEELWDRTIAVNLTGVWLCMKYEIPEMLKAGGGAIVNASSAAGVIGVANHYAYVAGKHAVVGITKSAALEFGGRGIRVNCVCPGIIDTPMTERFLPAEARPLFEEGHALKRFGTAREVAECVVWLCSDAASFVTGHAMLVDGGITAQ